MKIYAFDNKILALNNTWLSENPYVPPIDPYNPLNLPANTIRCRFVDGYTPTYGDTQTLVDAEQNIWDIYKAGSNWNNLFNVQSSIDETRLVEVLGANTTGIEYMVCMFNNCKSLTTVALFDTSNVLTMFQMFCNCTSLTSVPLFDTSNVVVMYSMFDSCTSLQSVPLFNTASVTDFSYMFYNCRLLQNIPLFDTSSATNMNSMFYDCNNVESGALALYQQASTQANPPSSHSKTFYKCGSNTTTGSAELQQIPSNWILY